jgi:ubiquinone/menaquinone biosynthesis C-methylase UbiE
MKKGAVELNLAARGHLRPDVQFISSSATDLSEVQDGSINVLFTSNFIELLADKKTCNRVFSKIRRTLRRGGCFIILGPNVKYAYREYWDLYHHCLPLSHLLSEKRLKQADFNVTRNILRLLPFSMKSRVPTAAWLIELYLMIPLAWRFMGKQFLIVAERPCRSPD